MRRRGSGSFRSNSRRPSRSIRRPSNRSSVRSSNRINETSNGNFSVKQCVVALILGTVLLAPSFYYDAVVRNTLSFDYPLLITISNIDAYLSIGFSIVGFITILLFRNSMGSFSSTSQVEMDLMRIRNAVESNRVDDILKRNK